MISSNQNRKHPELKTTPQWAAQSLNDLLYVARAVNQMSLKDTLTHSQRRSISHCVEMILSDIAEELLTDSETGRLPF